MGATVDTLIEINPPPKESENLHAALHGSTGAAWDLVDPTRGNK